MNTRINRRNFLSAAAASTLATSLTWGGRAVASASASESSAFKTQLKKGVGISMLPGKLPMEDRMKLAKEVGFDGVEANTTEDPKAVEQIKNAAEKAGIQIHSVMNSAHWDFPLSSDDPAAVAKSLKGMETSLRNAKAWGAETVLLVPAVVGEKTMYRDAYTRSQTQIRKLLPLAEELKIIIAIENVWNKFLLSPLEFARYVDEFNSPYLQAYFDIGNIVLYGYPQDWIRTLGKRIKKLHIKGFDGPKMKWTKIREGSIKWPEVRKALDEIGYNGYMTAEVEGGDKDYLKSLVNDMELIIAGQ